MRKANISKGLPFFMAMSLLLSSSNSQGQNRRVEKPMIDSSVFKKWPRFSSANISLDGNYVFYTIDYPSSGSTTLVVQNVRGSWKKEFINASDGQITADNQLFLFQMQDSLCLLRLGADRVQCIAGVENHQLFEQPGRAWLLYQQTGSDVLKIIDLNSKVEKEYSDVVSYQLNHKKGMLLIRNIKKLNSGKTLDGIDRIDLQDNTRKNIWQSGKEICSGIAFDRTGTQLAFLTKDTSSVLSSINVWYYNADVSEAKKIASNQSEEVEPGEKITDMQFSVDGRHLFFDLIKEEEPLPEPAPDAIKVNIWNYKDAVLQSMQLTYSPQKQCLATIAVQGISEEQKAKIIRLQKDGDQFFVSPGEVVGDYLLSFHRKKNVNGMESWWNPDAMSSIELISLKNGDRKLLRDPEMQYGSSSCYIVSPGGKYVVYFDNSGGKKATLQWYSYEIATGLRRCLTKGIKVPFNIELTDYDMPESHYFPNGRDGDQIVAGWVGRDEKVLLYDRYDIWEVDLAGRTAPLNWTNGYGRKHQVRFVMNNENRRQSWERGDSIVLKALDKQKKYSGYFIKTIGRSDCRKLFMGAFQYDGLRKAINTNVWLVGRETASEAPNLFITKDGKHFTPITDIQPQRQYNWLTAELVNWTTFDGRPGLGILYKPENFDLAKKYPVIFQYYEQKSDQFNTFIYPQFTGAEINIPYFVSQGYLIFVPDIHYKIQQPGASAYNYIVSAATMLMKRPYVDSKHMGLQGHSFGGYQTEFIVTHSHLFVAAMASAGWPDFISRYGAIIPSMGVDGKFTTETQRSRIGATIWERPDLYIKNSPIFYVDKITTPLLMMNNKADDQVPYAQGIEMFTAMRRLNKKCWMLEYDNGTHWVNGQDEIDYTIRINQFFDYYLKNKPAPKWMTQGVPARMKGLDNGYELDAEHEP